MLEAEGGAAALAVLADLPKDSWDEYWTRIFIPPETKERVLGQALLSLRLRQQLSMVGTSVHGLVLLAGPAGSGKSSLCRGVANELAKHVGALKFGEIDADALPGDLLGHSQRAVKRLFDSELRILAESGGRAVLLIDEVESLAVSRSEASLKANPVDVHRATNAVLDGLDQAAINYRNLLLLATTNFVAGVDEAFLSRADAVIHIPLPDEETAALILEDTLVEYAKQWPALARLASGQELRDLGREGAGLSGRALRKIVMQAAAADLNTAKDPGKLTFEQLRAALRTARESRAAPEQTNGRSR